MAKIRIRSAGRLIAWLMRLIGATLRFEIEDRAGAFSGCRDGFIWAFWHNRIFLVPWFHERWFGHVPGTILTSPSGDGQIIADVCAEFGIEAERGSSSRPQQGMSALIALAEKVREHYDIGITPDGPRGPKHKVQPGIIKLAQLTGGRILPCHINYSHAIRFKTWDEFLLPLPFARVTMIFDTPFTVPRRMSEEEFEKFRSHLERLLIQGTSSQNSSC